jgi:hypothetical protein
MHEHIYKLWNIFMFIIIIINNTWTRRSCIIYCLSICFDSLVFSVFSFHYIFHVNSCFLLLFDDRKHINNCIAINSTALWRTNKQITKAKRISIHINTLIISLWFILTWFCVVIPSLKLCLNSLFIELISS